MRCCWPASGAECHRGTKNNVQSKTQLEKCVALLISHHSGWQKNWAFSLTIWNLQWTLAGKLLRNENWIFRLFLTPRVWLHFTSALLTMTPLSVNLLFSLWCVWWPLNWERIAYLPSCVLCPPQTAVANCISVNHDYIFCGCADGTVRIFNPLNLHFVTTLPKPHFLGTDIASVTEARYCGEVEGSKGGLWGLELFSRPLPSGVCSFYGFKLAACCRSPWVVAALPCVAGLQPKAGCWTTQHILLLIFLGLLGSGGLLTLVAMSKQAEGTGCCGTLQLFLYHGTSFAYPW